MLGLSPVMAGLDPGIHVFFLCEACKDVDGRVVLREDAFRALARP
jgi:hypothetical protein